MLGSVHDPLLKTGLIKAFSQLVGSFLRWRDALNIKASVGAICWDVSWRYLPKIPSGSCAFWVLGLYKRGLMPSVSIWSRGMLGNGLPLNGWNIFCLAIYDQLRKLMRSTHSEFLVYQYMWPDLQEGVLYAHHFRTQISPPFYGYIIRQSMCACFVANSSPVCFSWNCFLSHVRRPWMPGLYSFVSAGCSTETTRLWGLTRPCSDIFYRFNYFLGQFKSTSGSIKQV